MLFSLQFSSISTKRSLNRVVLLLFAIVLFNHTNLFEVKVNEVSYIYHLLLNGIAKYYIANFVTVYVLSGNVTTAISAQLFQYVLFGLYVSHIKTKLTERKEGKRHFGAVAAIFNVFVSLSWLDWNSCFTTYGT